ncbi:MAG: hypothetical protein PHC75_03295, partial [Burkholderiales bacterium]|nr:hypothetical protein [Burkholderiales bacterium]
MSKTKSDEFEFIFNSLYKKYKKYEISRKEYCEIFGISDRTLKRRIDSGKGVVQFNVSEETGKYTWKLVDIAKYFVEKNYFAD